jgi:alkanesulfonate monooxygenase SsuD/methylene tetrahydromethanopterin reductase-like flavin-dependent oxidoreductase (luciferase family)
VISAREPLKILDRREEGYRRIPLIGTPDDIVNDLRQFKELGVQHFVLDTFYSVPELDRETLADALRTIERFAREIRPAVVD